MTHYKKWSVNIYSHHLVGYYVYTIYQNLDFPLKVELEFLDDTKCRIHEKEFIYDGAIPVPSVGERVSVEGVSYEVTKRDYIYLTGEGSFPDLKISIWLM